MRQHQIFERMIDRATGTPRTAWFPMGPRTRYRWLAAWRLRRTVRREAHSEQYAPLAERRIYTVAGR